MPTTVIQDATYWQNLINTTTNDITSLQSSLAKSTARYADWNSLCARQKCDANALGIINTEAINMKFFKDQIDIKNSALSGYKESLRLYNLKTPTEKAADVQASIDATKADTAKTRTIAIAISAVIIIVVGIYFYNKYRKGKAVK